MTALTVSPPLTGAPGFTREGGRVHRTAKGGETATELKAATIKAPLHNKNRGDGDNGLSSNDGIDWEETGERWCREVEGAVNQINGGDKKEKRCRWDDAEVSWEEMVAVDRGRDKGGDKEAERIEEEKWWGLLLLVMMVGTRRASARDGDQKQRRRREWWWWSGETTEGDDHALSKGEEKRHRWEDGEGCLKWFWDGYFITKKIK